MNQRETPSSHVHFHFASAPPIAWNVNMRLMAGGARNYNEEIYTPVSGQETKVADDGMGTGNGVICVMGKAYHIEYGPAVGVYASIYQQAPDPNNHQCGQGTPANTIGADGAFTIHGVQSPHAASPGVSRYLLVCIEYIDPGTTFPVYLHKVVPFYGVTSTETECD